MVAISKLNKPTANPESYRPVSLLCIPYNIMERLIYTHIKTYIDLWLALEQAGFRCEKSITHQVNLLTQEIEASFSAEKKAAAVFVDLTASRDAVWHRGLMRKFLCYCQTGT